mgnify:CR=1 FL=1
MKKLLTFICLTSTDKESIETATIKIGQKHLAISYKSIEALLSSHSELVAILTEQSNDNLNSDFESRSRLRNIDVQLARIHEELNAGRQDTLAELRSDISELSEAIIQLAKSKQPKE